VELNFDMQRGRLVLVHQLVFQHMRGCLK